MKNSSYLKAIIAFCIFGFMPIYWSSLSHVDSTLILFHRSFWIVCSLTPYLIWKSRLKKTYFVNLGILLKKNWKYLLLSSLAISINWLGYIYSINHGHVIEAGLAYYLSPLLTIILSLVFLKESMSKKQWIAIACMFLAIFYLLVAKGIFPKFAFTIGISFSIYGILSRLLQFPILERMLLETFLIALFLGVFVIDPFLIHKEFMLSSHLTQGLLVSAGLVSMVPIFLYIACTKLLKFSTIGILSFILPTQILILSIFYFQTPWEIENILCMSLLWPSIGLYIFDLYKEQKKTIKVENT